MSTGLNVTGLSVRLGSQLILDEVTMAAAPGTVTGIIGPNGAGKSTLLQAILQLAPLSGGTITFDGADLVTMSRRSRAQFTAFVEQNGHSDVRLTAREVALLGRIPFQSVWQVNPSPIDDEQVDAAMAAVGMAEFAERLYHTLSGGEQQRIQLARALVQRPSLLLLDEPTSQLDIHAQLAVLDLLRLHARAGATVLLAVHDLNLAAAFCDQLMVLQAGRRLTAGTPDQVLTPALLRQVYGVEAAVLRHPVNGRPIIAYDLPR
ncbi:MAG TPA: ABC transporter ATP-binding protein [Devosia sp.]|nr:ABC transporter ATP-binding protein [Devosia sp.]